jgi:hypothetical protein
MPDVERFEVSLLALQVEVLQTLSIVQGCLTHHRCAASFVKADSLELLEVNIITKRLSFGYHMYVTSNLASNMSLSAWVTSDSNMLMNSFSVVQRDCKLYIKHGD